MKMPKMSDLSERWAEAAEGWGERAEQGREMFVDRADASREMLAERAEMIREQFAEHYDQGVATQFAGWTLVSSGLALGATMFLRGRRSFGAYILPLILGVTGLAVMSGRSAWERRAISISDAEARVRDQLAGLDPVARFQVLRDVAGETVPFVKHIELRRN
ncbi:MAG TPA: hypothetical protein VFG89_06660 [Coriobacteriia bacterium]|nr:hypothetical protein [Coriobacteriia bacterium]